MPHPRATQAPRTMFAPNRARSCVYVAACAGVHPSYLHGGAR